MSDSNQVIDLRHLTDAQRREINIILGDAVGNAVPNSLNLPATSDPKPYTPPTKHWTQSKTMWFNIAATLLGLAGFFVPILDSVLPFAKPFMDAEVFALLVAIIGAANMALRRVTESKIQFRSDKPKPNNKQGF